MKSAALRSELEDVAKSTFVANEIEPTLEDVFLKNDTKEALPDAISFLPSPSKSAEIIDQVPPPVVKSVPAEKLEVVIAPVVVVFKCTLTLEPELPLATSGFPSPSKSAIAITSPVAFIPSVVPEAVFELIATALLKDLLPTGLAEILVLVTKNAFFEAAVNPPTVTVIGSLVDLAGTVTVKLVEVAEFTTALTEPK